MGTTSLAGAVWQFVQYLFLFGLVLALAYFATRSLRRLAPGGKGRYLRLIDQIHLGTNRSFYLLGVADRVVLVAMGEGGVAAVTTLDDPAQVAELLAQPEATAPGAGNLVGGLAANLAQRAPSLPGALTALLGSSAAAIGQGVQRLRQGRATAQPDFAALLRAAAADVAAADGGEPSAGSAFASAQTVAPPAADSSEARLGRQVARLKKLVQKAEA